MGCAAGDVVPAGDLAGGVCGRRADARENGDQPRALVGGQTVAAALPELAGGAARPRSGSYVNFGCTPDQGCDRIGAVLS
jgi:hypothetical protein